MEFFQLGVFAEQPFEGNQLAVFPDAGDLKKDQMQAIAREMNLPETTFVTHQDEESYEVRIFTPSEELPFAGHPTIGTTWLLQHLARVSSDEVTQVSAAGETVVVADGDRVWFTRTGSASPDLQTKDERASEKVAAALGLDVRDIGFEARELGRPGRLGPAFATAGLLHLIVPVRDLDALGRVNMRVELVEALDAPGAYCIAPYKAGVLRARGFFPEYGVSEDPGTGSAAAALGLYLSDRVGDIDLEVIQGIEMNRPCHIGMRVGGGTVKVGGRCELIFAGRLEVLP
jgi:trans-2,3-dihydro-3-hydroxyanthranilate isomerase